MKSRLNEVAVMDYTIDPNWIYIDGKPAMKQFDRVIVCQGVHINVWPPSLEELSVLESRYRDVLEAKNIFHIEVWHNLLEQIRLAGGKAHCKITHEYTGDIPPWWCYRVNEKTVGFDWVDTPKNPINLELGNAFYRAFQRYHVVAGRVSKFEAALKDAIRLRLDKETGSRYGHMGPEYPMGAKQLVFKINERDYWYHLTPVNGSWKWELLSWPETEKILIKV